MLREPSLRPRPDTRLARIFRSLAIRVRSLVPLRHNRRFWQWGSAAASGLIILTLFVTIAPRLLQVQAAGPSYCPTSTTTLSNCITSTSGTGIFLSGAGTLYAAQNASLAVTSSFSGGGNKANCFKLTAPNASVVAPNPQHTSSKQASSLSFTVLPGAGNGPQTITATALNDQGSNNCQTTVDTANPAAQYTLDNTGPTVTPNVSPAPNGAGWDKANATVTLTVADAASGVKSTTYTVNGGPSQNYSGPFTVSVEGVTAIAYTATDNVSNATTGTVTVKLDKTGPTISGAATPAANGNGWNNTSVTVTFTCSDPNGANGSAGSGIASCAGSASSPGATTISTQGFNQPATGTATDTAGNSTSATVSNINIDETPPTLTAIVSTPISGSDPTSAFWYNGDVTIHWLCQDPALPGGHAGSGVATCAPDNVITGEGRGLTASATVSDRADNSVTTASPVVNIDTHAPTTGLAAPVPDWTNNNVTLSFVASDNLSGVAATYYVVDGSSMATGSSVTISAEGTHTVQYWSQDYAGNIEATHTATVKIDKTAPTISHALTPPANGAGWNNANVTVTFTCADPVNGNGTAGSGVATCDRATGTTGSTGDSTEGSTDVTGTAVDNAGNSTPDTATVNLDKTPPSITGSADRPANVHGWYNAPVTVAFTCSDPENASNGSAGSGIATGGCPAPTTLNSDGKNQHVSGTATDVADNTASTTVSGISIDQTPPSLSGAPTSAANGAGWYRAPVTIHWTCADALSGIDGGCPADTTISGEGRNLTSSASVSDQADNTTTADSAAVNIDTTAPVTTIANQTSAAYTDTSGALWYAGNVSVDLSATDNLSGVAVTYITVDGSPAVAANSVTVSGAGHHTVTFWSVDDAGNVEDKTGAGNSVAFTIDLTPPDISGAPDRAPNVHGWYNAAVTVTFTCADHESGVASCTSPITLSGEGFNQQASGVAVDHVGNSAGVTVSSINIDETPPTLSGAPATPANGDGWYNGDVAIVWTCPDPLLTTGDPGSGVAACPANSTITGEGHGLKASATVSDLASNSTTADSAPVNIDRTQPSLTGAIVTTPSGTDAASADWYNTNVAIHWSCADPDLADRTHGSGVVACPSDSVITGEGPGLSTSASISDHADNTTFASSPQVNIDRTPPDTIITAPAGWNNTDVTISFSANDNLSGVKATHYTVDGGAEQNGDSLTLSDEGDHTVSFYSVDYAGNKEVAKTVHVKIDKTAPTISDTHSPVPNVNGWNHTDVTVTFTCVDPNNANGTAGSGIASCDGIVGDTGSTAVTAEGKDQVVTGVAVDNANNTASDPAMVSIDKTAPTISGKTDRDPDSNGWYNAPVTVTFTCDDPAPSAGITPSGVASCDAPVIISADGRNRSASGTAADNADNSASTTVSGIKLDQQPPVVTGAPITGANSAGWYNSDVTIHWTCSDPDLADGTAGSGIATCPANSVITGEGNNLQASASATDVAGNTGDGSVIGIKIDRTPPSTTASAPTANYTDVSGNLYYQGAVSVTLTATDNLSGPAHTYYTLDGGAQHTYSAPVTIIAEGAHTLTFWSVDNADNVEDPTATGNTVSFRIDNTPPTITASAAPAATSFGWNKSAVTVTFTCADPALSDGTAGSGVASCGAPVTLTGEGAGQSASGTTADNVGNTVSTTRSNIKIDLTKPVLNGAPTTGPNGFGWYNGDVTIHWTATDNLSGIDPTTQPGDSVITGEGAGLTAHASVSDQAGNTTSATSPAVNIDRIPPGLTGAITTTPSGHDPSATPWYNGPVVVGWKACDALSGVDPTSVPGSSSLSGGCYNWSDTVTGEGAALSSSETAADKANNTSNASVTGIHIDTAPPVTTIGGAPTDWTNTTVNLTLNATDNLSGVASTFYTVDGGAQQNGTAITLSGEGVHTIQFWSADYAGNTETTHSVTVKIDTTAPTITHSQAPLANSNNWNKSDVTVTFTCADTLSGVQSCDGVSGDTGSTGVATEGQNQSVIGVALDNAGNSATDTASVSIDTTAPSIVGAPDRPANAHGWYNAAVTVSFTCSDPNGANGSAGSGIASCPTPSTLGEGANQSVSGSATDFADNSASATVSHISIDTTPPTISGAIPTAPSGTDADGHVWYNSDVTVHWTCADTLSGLDGACPADTVISPAGGNGANLSASASVSDKAGNSTTATVDGVNIDRVAPDTTAALASSASTAGVWYGGPVSVTLTATDNLSGVAKTTYTVDGGAAHIYSAAFTVDGDGVHTITFKSVDYAHNTETTRTQTISIDEAAPAISGAPTTSPNGAGWYNDPVTVRFTCSDSESGLASCAGAAASPGGITLSGDGGSQHATGVATDNVGNSANATVSGLDIDRTRPALTVSAGGTSFTDGGALNTGPSTFTHTITTPFTLGAAPNFTCAATDATSGFGAGATCAGSVSGGTSGGVGSYTYTATSTDLAGNTTRVVVSYQVVYGFSGFLQPVNYTAHQIGASSSQFKGGATVPVKFQLRLANGTVIQAATAPLWVDPLNAGPTSSSPSSSAGSAPATTSGAVYRWDASGQQYIYTWNTASGQVGSWWRIGVKLDDGQTYDVFIALR